MEALNLHAKYLHDFEKLHFDNDILTNHCHQNIQTILYGTSTLHDENLELEILNIHVLYYHLLEKFTHIDEINQLYIKCQNEIEKILYN
jgi:hypothetical protein